VDLDIHRAELRPKSRVNAEFDWTMKKLPKAKKDCKHNRPNALICFDKSGKRQMSLDKNTAYGYLWCSRCGSFKVIGLRGWAGSDYMRG
jgi:hypothetical protein